MTAYRRKLWRPILACLLFSLACNLPTKTPVPTGTVAPGVTESVTPGVPVSSTPLPTETATLTAGATPTGSSSCVLRASYVADVTIPDDTKISKGATFLKTWRIRNSGTCPWVEGMKLVYLSGNPLGAPVSVAVSPTAPNGQVDISVSMTAPMTPGTYRSNWQMHDPQGKPFGDVFYVQIIVEGTPSPTLTMTPAAAPGNFNGTVAADCKSVTFTWSDARGETAYRLEGPSLLVNLPADATTYVWNNPPAGSSVVTLIATGQGGAEIGRVSTTVTVSCSVTGVDLYVDTLSFDPAPPVAFLPLKVTVQVRNRGTVNSGSFIVRWWGGKNFPSVSCEWSVDGVAAGTAVTLSCDNFTYRSPYSSVVTKVHVDVENAITESDETNNISENNLAVISPQTVYDFIAKAPTAVWRSGDPVTDLTWNGSTGDTQGFARYADGQLETGNTIQGHCLQTHPKWVANGWISGYYENLYTEAHYLIHPNDTFYAVVGLLQGANAGNVTFKVILRASSSGEVTIAQVNDTYGDGMKTISVNLTPYAGQNADMVLWVDAGANADQDWACWLQAAIFRRP